MALPPSLLQTVEKHPCISGCYRDQFVANAFADPNQPPEKSLVVSCADCYDFRLVVLSSLLTPTMTAKELSDLLSEHMRQQRGYGLSFGGYHYGNGAGFWLTAVYYPLCGVFLLNGRSSRSVGSDLDLLIMALKQKVVPAPDVGMLDPANYNVQTVYLDITPLGTITDRQSLFSCPRFSLKPRVGWNDFTMAEYLPAVQALTTQTAVAAPQPIAPPNPVTSGTNTSASNANSASTATRSTNSTSSPPTPASGSQVASTKGTGNNGKSKSTSPKPRPVRPPNLQVGELCPACGQIATAELLFTGTVVACGCDDSP